MVKALADKPHPELALQDSHSGRRKSTSASYPLISRHMPWHLGAFSFTQQRKCNMKFFFKLWFAFFYCLIFFFVGSRRDKISLCSSGTHSVD